MNDKFNIAQFMSIFENSKTEGDKIFFAENIYEAIKYAAQRYSFDILKSITAFDTGEGTELTYRLYSTVNEEEALLSTIVKAETQSVTDIYKSAIADENENKKTLKNFYIHALKEIVPKKRRHHK